MDTVWIVAVAGVVGTLLAPLLHELLSRRIRRIEWLEAQRLEIYAQSLPQTAADTLVTKVMLGVFGCIPAFDSFFIRGFGIPSHRPLREKTLMTVGDYYESHEQELRAQKINTLKFATGVESFRPYTSAKIIDMVFFIEGS